MKRVVITGMGAMTGLGNSWATAEKALKARFNTVRSMPEWYDIDGLNTHLGAPSKPFERPAHYTRKRVRSMGRLSLLATMASERAISNAGLVEDPILKSGDVGVAFGSSSGVPDAVVEIGQVLRNKSTDTINANSYIKMMPHATAVNVSVFFGICGRLIPTSTACTSGSLAIGMAYEAIKHGQQKIMVAGGAEEISVLQAAVFDTLVATSTMNESPERTPRPFDKDRDGMVVGEGAGCLVLEELEHAKARGSAILAEVVGFGTTADGQHVTQPTQETMAQSMKLAMRDRGVLPDAIDYVSAHGTGTLLGDIRESHATRAAIGRSVPISSMKSYIGHTLGACGAIEAWLAVEMMNAGWFAPTINLDNVDSDCADLDYITDDCQVIDTDYVMSNNFAFGGVNTSLIFRRWPYG